MTETAMTTNARRVVRDEVWKTLADDMFAGTNAVTIASFDAMWRDNWIANWDRVKGLPGIKKWFHKFKGLPAIVIGGGPSLAAGLEHVARNQRGYFKIVCDRMAAQVREAGIKPDLIITGDPQEVVADWFISHPAGQLVTAIPWQHPKVFDNIQPSDLVIRTSWSEHYHEEIDFWRFVIYKYLNGDMDYFGGVPPMATVGSEAALLCCKMKFNPILMLGLDGCIEETKAEEIFDIEGIPYHERVKFSTTRNYRTGLMTLEAMFQELGDQYKFIDIGCMGLLGDMGCEQMAAAEALPRWAGVPLDYNDYLRKLL